MCEVWYKGYINEKVNKILEVYHRICNFIADTEVIIKNSWIL